MKNPLKKLFGKKENLSEQWPSEEKVDREVIGQWNIVTFYSMEKDSKRSEAVLKMIAEESEDCTVILMDYNQREQIQGSENVGFIYDAEYEYLCRSHIKQVITVGKRCYDYKMRCLLAGVPEDRIDTAFLVNNTAELVKLSEVKNICFVISPSTWFEVEQIRTKLTVRMNKGEVE